MSLLTAAVTALFLAHRPLAQVHALPAHDAYSDDGSGEAFWVGGLKVNSDRLPHPLTFCARRDPGATTPTPTPTPTPTAWVGEAAVEFGRFHDITDERLVSWLQQRASDVDAIAASEALINETFDWHRSLLQEDPNYFRDQPPRNSSYLAVVAQFRNEADILEEWLMHHYDEGECMLVCALMYVRVFHERVCIRGSSRSGSANHLLRTCQAHTNCLLRHQEWAISI